MSSETIDIQFPDELREMLLPGKKVRRYFGKKDRRNQLMHIRAVVDEEYIVYRVWSRRRRWWVYKIDWWYYFYMDMEYGYLQVAK